MCRYSATEGVPGDWHLVHLGRFATGGAGAGAHRGDRGDPRRPDQPAGQWIWTGAQAEAWRRIAGFAHGQGTVVGMQLAHAGRKGATRRPWDGPGSVPPEASGWPKPAAGRASEPTRSRSAVRPPRGR